MIGRSACKEATTVNDVTYVGDRAGDSNLGSQNTF